MSKTPRASECTKLTDSVLHLRPGTHTDIKRKGKEKKREEGIKKKKKEARVFSSPGAIWYGSCGSSKSMKKGTKREIFPLYPCLPESSFKTSTIEVFKSFLRQMHCPLPSKERRVGGVSGSCSPFQRIPARKKRLEVPVFYFVDHRQSSRATLSWSSARPLLCAKKKTGNGMSTKRGYHSLTR